jgi:hypothetical protein
MSLTTVIDLLPPLVPDSSSTPPAGSTLTTRYTTESDKLPLYEGAQNPRHAQPYFRVLMSFSVPETLLKSIINKH